MTIRELQYSKVSVSLHELDIFLCHVLRKSKEYMYSHPEHVLTKTQLKKLMTLIERGRKGEPIAYIIGHKEFYDLDFIVNKHVLIPRPDTELLVEKVLEYFYTRKSLTPIIADIGTGSGNIAITIKKNFPTCTMLATDISKPALAIAKHNAKLHKTTVRFFQGDIVRALPRTYRKKVDALIFNAPYLTKTEARKKNLAFEPQIALTPPGKPTELIERFLKQATEFLQPGGVGFLEIGHRQAKPVSALCKTYFPECTITIHKDLGDFDRVLAFTKG